MVKKDGKASSSAMMRKTQETHRKQENTYALPGTIIAMEE